MAGDGRGKTTCTSEKQCNACDIVGGFFQVKAFLVKIYLQVYFKVQLMSDCTSSAFYKTAFLKVQM